MAGIDKTYTNKYVEYKQLKDWICPVSSLSYNKKKIPINLKDYLYEYEESNFGIKPLPVLNTPIWMDAILWQYCDIPFIRNRLQEAYPNNYLNKIKVGVIPSTYKQNRKITTHYNRNFYNKSELWQVQTDNELWYNTKYDFWANPKTFPINTNIMEGKSIKSIIRRLRKMYLPSSIKFIVSGKYIKEEFILKVKK